MLSGMRAVCAQQNWEGWLAGKWWKYGWVVDELKLSPEQQANIESLWIDHRRTLIDQKAELDKRHLQLSEILSNIAVDETTASQAFEKVQAARSAIDRTTFIMRVRIKNTLSSEQQKKLERLWTRFRRGRDFQGAPPISGGPAKRRLGQPAPPKS